MNLKEISVRKWLDSACALVMGLISLLALCFPLQKGGDKYWGMYKYQENGFDLFDFNSIARPEELEWLTIIVAIICIMQLLLSIGVIGFAIANLFSNKFEKIVKNSLYVCILLCLVYGVMGIILNAVYLSNKNGLWLDDYGYLDIDKVYVSVYTLSYIPFILVVVIFVIYFLINKVLSSKNEQRSETSKKQTVDNVEVTDNKGTQNKEYLKQDKLYEVKNSVEVIKTYKELLDNGAITQQEYDEIKNNILKM